MGWMWGLLGCLAVVGCGYPDYGFDPRDARPGDSGAVDSRADATVSDAAPITCPTKGGAMVNLGTWCIDETEVTIANYKSFLAAKAGDTSGQIPACSWNAKYEPAGGYWPPADTYSQYPVTAVDWCDAYAYCRWAGKRLCGGFGNKPTPANGQNDATRSQWFNACSNGGPLDYPYGAAYDAQKCNGLKYDAGAGVKWVPNPPEEGGLIPVKSAPGCRGTKPPYDKIHDLAGNAWEWTDDCNANVGATDQCRKRGGGFIGLDGTTACSSSPMYSWTDRRYLSHDIGFRCCAD